MSQGTGKLIVHHRSRAAIIGTLDGFFLMRCFGEVSPSDVQATLVGHEAAVACRPEGSGAIVAVDSTAAFPSEETRRTALAVTRKTGSKTSAHVLVVLGDGFWASAVRGIMTTLASLSPANHPRKVVRYEEEGVDWAIEALGESPAKYRPLLLAALAQLKVGTTAPPPPSSKSS
jgi:hypothetical protein